MNGVHLSVGDRLTEITPSGVKRPRTVVAVDVEPKYPQPEDRPYVRLRDDANGQTFVMSERIIFSIDWITLDD